MSSKLFKILLLLTIIVLFVFVIIDYNAGFFRKLLIVIGAFAFLLASWEAYEEHKDDDHFPTA